MKMKEFLAQIMEATNNLQLNIDKKEYNILLHIRGKAYSIQSISYDPFNNNWKVLLLSSLDYFSIAQYEKPKVKTLDDIHYLQARNTMMNGMQDHDIVFQLVELDGLAIEPSFRETHVIDIKSQKVDKVKVDESWDLKYIAYLYK